MDKNILINLINELLKPLGFKRKGNIWLLEQGGFSKFLKMQKSQYSNLFYLDYGFILNKIDVDDFTNRYSKGFETRIDVDGNILDLLDFENKLDEAFRVSSLKAIICKDVIENFNNINSEEEILNDIVSLKNEKLIFKNIRQYFKIKPDGRSL